MNDSSLSNNEMREMVAAYRPSSGMELPEGRMFDSRAPRLSPTEFVEWCEEMMKLGNVSPERHSFRCSAEFKL